MYDRFKLAILRRFRYQVDFALATGIHENLLSRIIQGRRPPTPEQKERMAQALDISLDQLEELFAHEVETDTTPRPY